MRSISRAKRPCVMSCFNSSEHIIGDNVTATMPEMITAPASVKANSRNKVPVTPPRNPIGAYTAAKVNVIEMTGPAISRAPISAACGGLLPSSMCR